MLKLIYGLTIAWIENDGHQDGGQPNKNQNALPTFLDFEPSHLQAKAMWCRGLNAHGT